MTEQCTDVDEYDVVAEQAGLRVSDKPKQDFLHLVTSYFLDREHNKYANQTMHIHTADQHHCCSLQQKSPFLVTRPMKNNCCDPVSDYFLKPQKLILSTIPFYKIENNL